MLTGNGFMLLSYILLLKPCLSMVHSGTDYTIDSLRSIRMSILDVVLMLGICPIVFAV